MTAKGTRFKRPVLERLGMRYFSHRSQILPPVTADDDIHYLNPRERAALLRITRWAVIRSATAGALSGGVTAVVEFLLRAFYLEGPQADFSQTLIFWAVVLGVTGVATFFEISFLYWDALRSVHRLAHAAGLDLSAPDQRHGVALALVRAALELPNPGERMLGVDPRREISRLWLIVATLTYKVKVGVTNFLFKMLFRRLAGRAGLRGAFDVFVAIPVTAAWNAWVTWRVLREARLRVMAPSAAAEYVALVVPHPEKLSAAGRLNLARAVASSVVRNRDMHPNLVALLAEVLERVGHIEGKVLDDWQLFLDELPRLPEDEQTMALRVLAVACVIDGRIGRREHFLLHKAHEVCARGLDEGVLRRLYRVFTRGEAVQQELLQRIG